MSVAQVTMNTHSSSYSPSGVALADPQQGQRRQERIDEAAMRTRPGPSRARSGSIRKTSGSRSRRRHSANRLPPWNDAPQRERDHRRAGQAADRQDRSSAAEPSPAGRVQRKRFGEGVLVEIGPQDVEEQQFGIGRLPQQEIAQADLARRADEQVERRQVGGLEPLLDRRFVDVLGVDRAVDRGRRQVARRSRNLGPRAIIEGDDQGQPAIARGPLDRAFEPGREIGAESGIIADQLEPDPLASRSSSARARDRSASAPVRSAISSSLRRQFSDEKA